MKGHTVKHWRHKDAGVKGRVPEIFEFSFWKWRILVRSEALFLKFHVSATKGSQASMSL